MSSSPFFASLKDNPNYPALNRLVMNCHTVAFGRRISLSFFNSRGT